VIQADGPLVTGPLSVRGKALTLRAAPECRPVLHLDGPLAAWQALLTTDRPLELDGIELRRGPGGEPAHLLCARGSSLRLVRCRVTAPHHKAPVVTRGVSRIELRDCQLLAGGLALCVEAGPGAPCAVGLVGNQIEVCDAGAAAVSVWAAGPGVGPVSIDAEGNEVRGSRVLSLRELTAGVAVTARSNRFELSEALLCVNGFGGSDAWRRAVVWRGAANRYRGPCDWLCVDGKPADVRRLTAWQQSFEAEPEPGD
jgi:hypothetical protein